MSLLIREAMLISKQMEKGKTETLIYYSKLSFCQLVSQPIIHKCRTSEVIQTVVGRLQETMSTLFICNPEANPLHPE